MSFLRLMFSNKILIFLYLLYLKANSETHILLAQQKKKIIFIISYIRIVIRNSKVHHYFVFTYFLKINIYLHQYFKNRNMIYDISTLVDNVI